MTCKDCDKYEVCKHINHALEYGNKSFEKSVSALAEHCCLFKNKNTQTPIFRKSTPPPPPILDERLTIPNIDYESPIQFHLTQMRCEMENDIYKAVQSCGVTVDKDELIKALTYDRQQYDKGFKDGVKACIKEIRNHYCSYDLNDYFSFNAVDEDTVDEIYNNMMEDVRWLNL